MRFARLVSGPVVGPAFRIVRDFHREWSRDRVGGLAAEIAFFALLGLFPAVIVFAAALSWLDVLIGRGAAADARTWLLEQVTGVFGTDNTLQSTLTDLFEQSNAGALTVGTALVLYASSRGFVAVVKALDVAYNLDLDERRGWLSSRLVGLGLTAFTVAVAALVVTMIVVGPLLGGGEELARRFGARSAFTTAWNWFRWPVVFGAVVAWAATVYHAAPRRREPWRQEIIGAVVATAWWMAVSLGFRSYLDAVSDGVNAVFGLLGGALSVLVWLYLLAMGLLVGAELNEVVASARQRGPDPEDEVRPAANGNGGEPGGSATP